jgi:hypothetical protein
MYHVNLDVYFHPLQLCNRYLRFSFYKANVHVSTELHQYFCVIIQVAKNKVQEEIRSRLKLGNACYHLVQNLSCSRLLSKNPKIKIYRTIIFPVVLYWCETWSLTLREEQRLRVF